MTLSALTRSVPGTGYPDRLWKVSLTCAGLAIFLLVGAVGGLRAQTVDSTRTLVRFRLSAFPVGVSLPLAVRARAAFHGWVPRGARVADWRAQVDAQSQSMRQAARLQRLTGGPVVSPPVAAAGPPLLLPDSLGLAPSTPLGLSRYVDINVELNGRFEAKVDQLRNLNCSGLDFARLTPGCQVGLPTPELVREFQLRASGVIADRIHVDVDFDSQREFSANNTINLRYQGFEDEILREVQVGNVDFQLPSSRFISSGVPANSFGVQTEMQIGPLEIRSILAQQKGSSVSSRVFTIGDNATQSVSLVTRDIDFERGRFFFVVDPRLIVGYPNIDVLDLKRYQLLPNERPVTVRVYRLRPQTAQIGIDPNLGGIDAVAVREDSPQRVGPFPWQLLVQGQDYFLHQSGAWFALARPLSNDEFLAVSFIDATGARVGTFPAVNGGADTLRLIHEPRRGADAPTFFYEMRNIYRIGGPNVQVPTVHMALTVNGAEQPVMGVGTYLSLLGMAELANESELDRLNRVFPRDRDAAGGRPIDDRFLVFPHLLPFADSVRLAPVERNDSLYRTPTYLMSTEAPPIRFTLDFSYDVVGSDDRGLINLGVFQVAQNSEQVRVGDRELVRGRDYEIDYDLGVITFSNPDSLFTGPTRVQVLFEENEFFDAAPMNVLGVSTTYNLGSRGRIDAVGLFQRERTVFSRPRLGDEPQAMFMGGVTANLEFRTPWVTNLLNGLPFISTDVPSTLYVNGELAVSRPNPNQAGAAFIEEFEASGARTIPLEEDAFRLGSRPSSGVGVPASYLDAAGQFSPDDAVVLVRQNVIQTAAGALQLGPREIDTSIVLTGSGETDETLLWLTLKPDTVGGAPHPATSDPRWVRPALPSPRWRSLSQPLDRTGLGVDLSRVEFLEFWLLDDFARTPERQGATLIFDFGEIAEDAVAFGPESLLVVGSDTTFTGFQFLGQGILDSEEDVITNTFNAAEDDTGIHGDLIPSLVDIATGQPVNDLPMCQQGFVASFPVYPLGDLGANCTRLNGRVDSEDLNGDNRLDVNVGTGQENFVRFVVPVGDPRFVVRSGVTLDDVDGRRMTWRLYRIPFSQDTIQVGTIDLRRVAAMRMTLATPDVPSEEEVSFALARMKLVGGQWLKRADTPIPGLGGLQGAPHGSVVASVISTENQDLGYVSPPGVFDEADRLGVDLGFGSQQINERSLRLVAEDIRVGERAEAFVRFANPAEQNLLQYRTLRVWARGRGAGWEEGDFEFFIKVGADEDNFFAYRTPVRSASWEPEILVDLNRWLDLRSQVEALWLSGAPPNGGDCGVDPMIYVACDGPYLVHIGDPGVSPPNLAQAGEVAVGFFRRAQTVTDPIAELWIDDIRLTEVVGDLGIATAFDARWSAADVAELRVSVVSRDGQFRTIEQTPDYLGDREVRLGTTFRVDKLMPDAWGLSIPVDVQYSRAEIDPFFVRGSDVRNAALNNAREPGRTARAFSVQLRRSRRGTTPVERIVLDPLAVSVSHRSSDETTELVDGSGQERQYRVEYDNRPGATTLSGAPGFLQRFVGSLPDWIGQSEFGRAVATSRLRLNPDRIRLTSTLANNAFRRFAFRVPVATDQDSTVPLLQSIVHTWRHEIGVDFRPYSSFGIGFDYSTTRDLRDYGDTTIVGQLLQSKRETFLGKDVGFERNRELRTRIFVSPVINSWLLPSFSLETDFVFYRDPNRREATLVDRDSILTGNFLRTPETISNSRRMVIGSTFELGQLVQNIFGASSILAALTRGVLPADVSFERELGSTFDGVTTDVDGRYQLALGGIGAFRERNGILAGTTLEAKTWDVSGGTTLPLGVRANVNFRDVAATTWGLLGDQHVPMTQRLRDWPAGSVSWVYLPNWELRELLSSLTAQASYRRSASSSVVPLGDIGGDVRTSQERVRIAPLLTIEWALGVRTSAGYELIESEVVTGGNVTKDDQTAWNAAVRFGIRPPSSVVRLPSEIRATVAMDWRNTSTCLQRPDVAGCLPVADAQTRQLDIQLDTALPPNMRGGARFTYVLNDQRHLSTKLSQIVFSVFMEINLLANQIR